MSCQLDLAGTLECLLHVQHLGYRLAHHHGTMVAQHQHALVRKVGKEALAFDYGFKVRPFFPRLIEPVAERHKWMDEQSIDHQIVGTWPDIFGYGLPRDAPPVGILAEGQPE